MGTDLAEKKKKRFTIFDQGIVKSYVLLARRHEINIAVNSLDRIYRQNEKAPTDYAQTLQICSSNVFRITKALCALYISCGIMFSSWPLISYMLFGSIEMAVPIFLPTFHFSTSTRLAVNWTYHICIFSVATFGFIFCDAMYADLVFHVHMMSGLIAKHWHFINEQLKLKTATSLEVKLLFRNVCKMHQEMTTQVE